MFLPKFKPVLNGILYRSPDKYDFVNWLERTFSDANVIESQECYLLDEININLQSKDKEIRRLTGTYLEFCFTHSLEQIITRPTRATNRTVTPIDHILYTYKLT